MIVALLALGAVASSWLLTLAVLRYARAHAILDIPNDRSSHSIPTPRGGGLAIAAVTLCGIVAGMVFGVVEVHVAVATVGGGLLIAAVGWIDDHVGVSARARAAVHFAAAAWALAWVGGLPALDLGLLELRLGLAGSALAAFAIVWVTNLYNFMDGIDGIAAGEAATVGAIGGTLLLLGDHQGLATISFLLAAAAAGFLPWNREPARIFMGDVGSGVVGFLFAVLAVASERAGALPLLIWILLLGVFVFDASATLLRRAARRDRWYEAHRLHAYQRAVRAGWSHTRVTGAVLAINAGLGLLGFIAWLRPQLTLTATAIAVAGLAIIYWKVERVRPMR